MDAPEMANALFEEVWWSHKVSRVITEFLLLGVKNLLGLFDAVACFFVSISVGDLVIS
jgi:hypothetical protein